MTLIADVAVAVAPTAVVVLNSKAMVALQNCYLMFASLSLFLPLTPPLSEQAVAAIEPVGAVS